jgi:hypothetical protein
MFYRKEKKKYSFIFTLSYTTLKGIEVQSEPIRISIEETSEERAKEKIIKKISKKVEIKFANIK